MVTVPLEEDSDFSLCDLTGRDTAHQIEAGIRLSSESEVVETQENQRRHQLIGRNAELKFPVRYMALDSSSRETGSTVDARGRMLGRSSVTLEHPATEKLETRETLDSAGSDRALLPAKPAMRRCDGPRRTL